jgi:PEP-CTERM motif
VSRGWRVLSFALASAFLAIAAPAAHAIPALQLYSPDAFYDPSAESWVINDSSFELWVVADVGSYGTIYDVDLAGSFYGSSGSILFTPIGSAPAPVIDPNPSDAGGYDNIIHHDEYANADTHQFWSLGNMSSTSDAIENYSPTGAGDTSTGTILKYMVTVSGYEAVHFDAFDHYYTGSDGASSADFKAHYVFAPPSHDLTGGRRGQAPEPGSMSLFAVGLAAMFLAARRKKAA